MDSARTRKVADLRRCEKDFAAARERAISAEPVANALDDLLQVEALANETALRFRQLATAAWELSRARAALPP